MSAVVAMGALTFAVIEGGAMGFATPRVLAALVLAVVGSTVFLLVQAHGAHPMVPLPLLRSRTMAVSVVVGFALNIGFYGVVFLVSLYFQQQRGLSSLATGLAFLPMAALIACMNAVAARRREPGAAGVRIRRHRHPVGDRNPRAIGRPCPTTST